jgi:hypothetical protein
MLAQSKDRLQAPRSLQCATGWPAPPSPSLSPFHGPFPAPPARSPSVSLTRSMPWESNALWRSVNRAAPGGYSDRPSLRASLPSCRLHSGRVLMRRSSSQGKPRAPTASDRPILPPAPQPAAVPAAPQPTASTRSPSPLAAMLLLLFVNGPVCAAQSSGARRALRDRRVRRAGRRSAARHKSPPSPPTLRHSSSRFTRPPCTRPARSSG